MTLLLYVPFLISFITGYLLVRILLKHETSLLFRLSLAGGLGLGVSGYLAYANFMIFSGYNAFFQIAANLFFLASAVGGNLLFADRTPAVPDRGVLRRDLVYVLLLSALFFPLHYLASFYPYGGWDAWAVWHLKSKFLFLAGEHWREIFDPVLWRSSPHYPLLLPFINTWGWAFSSGPVSTIPQLSSLIFAFLTAALLVSSLGTSIDKRIAFVPALILLTLPLYAKTAISQYADGVLGFYLLASIVCASLAQREQKRRYGLLSGLFVGFLSFSKAEGLLAALILIFLFALCCGRLWRKAERPLLWSFLAGLGMTLVPSLLFYAFMAPESTTSINGFVSAENPSTWDRLLKILAFYVVEAVSIKWNGIWIMILLAVIFGGLKIWRENVFAFKFLALYLAAIALYYWMNTYFEILWWMSVSLNRILCTLLPVALWWVFGGIWKKES